MSDDAKEYRRLIAEMDTARAVREISEVEFELHNTLTTRSQYASTCKIFVEADKAVRVHVYKYGLPSVDDRKIRDE